MKVKFHGGRGSHAVCATPKRVHEILHDVWEFARKKKIQTWKDLESALGHEARSLYQIYGGNTTCLELKTDKAPMPVFLDAGTGLTQAGMDPTSALNNADFKKGQGKVAFFFTHTHWDHIAGLLTIEQLFQPGNEFHFYSVHKNLSERLQTLFKEEHFPVPFRYVAPNFKFHQIALSSSLEFGELAITHFPQTHPGGSFAYRVFDGSRTLVFATDTELKNINPPHMTPGSSVYSDADVLILDAQFSPEDITSKEGYGHSQIHTAVDFAVRERVKTLYLFHQSPYYSDQMIDEQLVRAREYLAGKYGKKQSLKIQMTIEGEEISV